MSDLTARMAEIRERIEAFPPIALRPEPAYPHPSLAIRLPLWTADDGSDTPEIVALYGSARRLPAFHALLNAPSDLAYLLDGLIAMQQQRDAARAEAAAVWARAARMQAVVKALDAMKSAGHTDMLSIDVLAALQVYQFGGEL
jgi:hypothetical protein